MPTCNTNIVGIQVVYCENGEQKSVWVDLDKVNALSWCDEEIKAKGKNQGGSGKLPTDKNGPAECPDVEAEGRSPLCWWNGSQWICGTE